MNWLTECRNAIQWGNSLRVDLFKSKHLGYLSLLAMMVTLVIGLILFLIDPSVNSPSDGIWAAWGTMTHVGFGDVVPTSFFGRLLAAGLILLGLVFFPLFTALVSVTLIGRNIDTLGLGMRRIEQETNTIENEESLILKELARLHKRINELEDVMLLQNKS